MTNKILILGIRSLTTISTENTTNKGNVRYVDVKKIANASFLLKKKNE